MSTQDTTLSTPSAEFLAEDKGPGVEAVLWTFAGLATVVLGLRCYVRLMLKSIFGIDDYVIVLAWVLLVCFCAVDSVAISLGLGRHLRYLATNATPTALVNIVFDLWLGNAFAVMANAMAKISFAFTLMRVMPLPWMRMLLWLIVVTLFSVNLVLVILVYAQCDDARTLWDSVNYPGACWPTSVLTNFALFTGAYSGAMDFTLAALPWFIIPQLNMKMREKIGVACAMSLGVVAGVAAIVKTVQLQTLNSDDPTFGQADLVIWGGVEIGTTIIAACIPTLRPIGRRLWPGSSAERYKISGDDHNTGAYHMNHLDGSNGTQFNPKGRGTSQTLVTIGSKPSRQAGGAGTMDDDSDRSILAGSKVEVTRTEAGSAASGGAGYDGDSGPDPAEGRHEQDGITATREVSIRYN